MKKLYRPIFFLCTSIIFLGLNSCDILEQLFVNLKLKEEITASGNDTPIFESVEDCLSKYDAYDEYKDQIQALKYVKAAYYSLEWTPSNLGGSNISATVFDCDSSIILVQSIPNKALASDYFEKPYEFILTQEEIDKFNQYLANYKNCDCFRAELRVDPVIPANSGPYSLKGVVEIIIEIEAKVN